MKKTQDLYMIIAQFGLLGAVGFVGLFYPGKPNPILSIVGFLVLLAGFVAIFWAGSSLGNGFTVWPQPTPKSKLIKHGLYRYLKHPMYSGAILFAVGWSMVSVSVQAMLLSIILIVLLNIKAAREEALLIKHFDGYGRYSRSTGRFFPKIK